MPLMPDFLTPIVEQFKEDWREEMNQELEYRLIRLSNKIIDKCTRCSHITEEDCCGVYDQPEKQWTRLMGCAMRTHDKVPAFEDTHKLNPLKASKRGVKQ